MAEDLTGMPLHQAIQDKLNRLIERGATPTEVMEATLTIAIAGKCGTDGARDTARHLFVTAGGLAKMADQHEADVAAVSTLTESNTGDKCISAIDRTACIACREQVSAKAPSGHRVARDARHIGLLTHRR